MNVSRIYRLLRIISLLQSDKGYTATELAAELGVSKRTVFRDLNSLELAHVPYYYDDKSHSYKIQKFFFLPPVNLSLDEALAILLTTGRLKTKANIPIISHGKKAAVKIEGVLPDAIRKHIGSVIDSLAMHLPPLADHKGADAYFDKISEAIVENKQCKIKYNSFYDGKVISATVNPLRLVFMHRAWYMLAWAHKHKQVRTYKLIRIENLTVSNKSFEPLEDQKVDTHFGQAWTMIPEGKIYDIHLHFEPMVAGNVAEINWHESQKVAWNDDGSLEFHARVDGISEITWWVLGYGDQVTVVNPPELADRIVTVAENMLAKHRKSSKLPIAIKE